MLEKLYEFQWQQLHNFMNTLGMQNTSVTIIARGSLKCYYIHVQHRITRQLVVGSLLFHP